MIILRNKTGRLPMCLDMLLEHIDGCYILRYLGPAFQQSISGPAHAALYARARQFAEKQMVQHRDEKNTKLALRYAVLHEYFRQYPPAPTASAPRP